MLSALGRGGRDLGAGGGAAGRVTTPVGGITGQGRAVTTAGAELTLCDRSSREALIGESLLSSAEEVGRVATIDRTVASCVVIVSSCLVLDVRVLREEQRKGMKIVSPSDRSLSCPSSGMGIWLGKKQSLSRVSGRNWRRRSWVWEGSGTVDDLLGALQEDLEEGREGNTIGVSGRLSIMGTGYRHTRPVKGAGVRGEEGSSTERRHIVISITGGVLAVFFNIRTPWRGFVCVLAPRCPDT